jgi:hypothetical protein
MSAVKPKTTAPCSPRPWASRNWVISPLEAYTVTREKRAIWADGDAAGF